MAYNIKNLTALNVGNHGFAASATAPPPVASPAAGIYTMEVVNAANVGDYGYAGHSVPISPFAIPPAALPVTSPTASQPVPPPSAAPTSQQATSSALSPPTGSLPTAAPSAATGARTVLWVTARTGEALTAEATITAETGASFDDLSIGHLSARQATVDGYLLLLASAQNQGQPAMAELLVELFQHFPYPSMVLSSGVCAGDRRQCQLGDVLAAASAYSQSNGSKKTTKGQENTLNQHHVPPRWRSTFERCVIDFNATTTWPTLPLSRALQLKLYARLYLEMQDQTSSWVAATGYNRALPLAQNEQVLRKLMPGWPKLWEMEPWWKDIGENKLPIPPSEVLDATRADIMFSSSSPCQRNPRCHWVNFLTGEAVRADNAFKELQEQNIDRSTSGLDMEACVFYEQCSARVPQIPALLAKGVVDHADPDKDDQFHQYGNQMATKFLLHVFRRMCSLSLE